MIWTIINNIYSALSSSKCFTWLIHWILTMTYEKGISRIPIFQRRKWTSPFCGKDFIKSFSSYEPQSFGPFLWRHFSRQITWALECGQHQLRDNQHSPRPSNRSFCFCWLGTAFHLHLQRFLGAWEYNTELTAVDECGYLLCLKWPSSYTAKIGAGVWRQLVNVVGTGGLSPRPARRGLLSTSCVAVWDGYRDIVADS